jgi:MFS family permease
MYSAASVVFFTRSLGLSAAQVGLALSVAGVMSFLSAVPSGQLADRFGSRRTTVAFQLGKAALMIVLTLVRSFPALLVVAALLGVTDRGNQVARQALIADVVGPDERVRLQAYSRSAANIGVSVGVALAAPVLATSTRGPFVVLLVGVAACYAAVSQATLRLPDRYRPAGRHTDARPLRPSVGFVALGLVTGFLALHVSILDVALPLWVLHATTAPRSIVSVLLLVNTIMVVALQVRVSRSSDSVRGATRALALSGVVTAAACVVFATARVVNGWLVVAVLVAAAAVLTAGELLQSAAGWGLSFGLSPVHGQGRHLGAFSLGAALQDVLGPGLVAVVALAHPPYGWLALAAALVLAGGVAVPLARRAERDLGGRGDPTTIPAGTTASVAGAGARTEGDEIS